jgi:hypothetical protein
MALASVLCTAQVGTADGWIHIDASETRKVRSLGDRCDSKLQWIVERCRNLRMHHEWTIFRAVRLVLWLGR